MFVASYIEIITPFYRRETEVQRVTTCKPSLTREDGDRMQTQAREAWACSPDLLPQPGPPTLLLPGGGAH